MASQVAIRIESEAPVASDPGRLEVTLVLACGCRVRRVVAADRIVDTVDGERIAVGKYPCPAGHAVTPPPPAR